MQRYAIVKDGVVLNCVDYAEQPIGTPAGFEEGAVAIQNNFSAPGWIYKNGVFTNPNPPEIIFMPTEEQLA